MTSKVKKTLKEIKNYKAPGIDKLTNDFMVLEGNESETNDQQKSDFKDKKIHQLNGKKPR